VDPDEQEPFLCPQTGKDRHVIILALIILVGELNIISSLIMTVMEKQKDHAILKSIGQRSERHEDIMVEGITIGAFGASSGP